MENRDNSEIILYIMVRTDLASMTPGRVAAQVSHATSSFHEHVSHHISNYQDGLVERWRSENGVFGKTVVLQVYNDNDISKMANAMAKEFDPVGIVTDQSYVIRDGQVNITVPMVTCGFFLTSKQICDRVACSVFGVALETYKGEQ